MNESQSRPVSTFQSAATVVGGYIPAHPGGLRFRLAAVAVLAAVAIVLLVLLLDSGHKTSKPQPTFAASVVSAAQLGRLATSVAHPVFWLGPKPGMTYELSRQPNGSIFVRYLPHGAPAGDPRPHLTVATYPFRGAYAAIEQVGAQHGATVKKLSRGGLAVVSPNHPDSVHLAYPGVDYQVEVYDPTAGRALAAVAGGGLAVLGRFTPAATPSPARPHKAPAHNHPLRFPTMAARRISGAGLHALARSLNHPVYWLGPRPGLTYEVTQTPAGRVYVRYLPAGTAIGSSHLYLTVGTYPYPAASGAIHALAKRRGATSLRVAGGGLGVLDPSHPQSVHLAFPRSHYEIEVFAPAPGTAERLVASGAVTAIR
jgi:hypothetical protein